MKKYNTIQIETELYKELKLYCIEHDIKISTFVAKIVKQSITTKMPTNVLKVGS